MYKWWLCVYFLQRNREMKEECYAIIKCWVAVVKGTKKNECAARKKSALSWGCEESNYNGMIQQSSMTVDNSKIGEKTFMRTATTHKRKYHFLMIEQKKF
jgi:hypothetical protein